MTDASPETAAAATPTLMTAATTPWPEGVIEQVPSRKQIDCMVERPRSTEMATEEAPDKLIFTLAAVIMLISIGIILLTTGSRGPDWLFASQRLSFGILCLIFGGFITYCINLIISYCLISCGWTVCSRWEAKQIVKRPHTPAYQAWKNRAASELGQAHAVAADRDPATNQVRIRLLRYEGDGRDHLQATEQRCLILPDQLEVSEVAGIVSDFQAEAERLELADHDDSSQLATREATRQQLLELTQHALKHS